MDQKQMTVLKLLDSPVTKKAHLKKIYRQFYWFSFRFSVLPLESNWWKCKTKLYGTLLSGLEKRRLEKRLQLKLHNIFKKLVRNCARSEDFKEISCTH